jgi:predicted aminopeptidase
MKVRRFSIPTVLSLALLCLTSCTDAPYYYQAARGHFEILRKREPIEKLLNSDNLSHAKRRQLEQALKVRDFASQQLQLPQNNSYRTYVELDRDYALWNVVAAPEFSLKARTWCFPVAGCVSYRGYFSEEDARSYARSLQQQGYDTQVSGVPAYSTLQWFDDPVLSCFSKWNTLAFARLIFHELAHQQLYVAGDSNFNEAFATSVELTGIQRWLEIYGTAEQRQLFAAQLARETGFVAWTGMVRNQLDELYKTGLDEATKRQRKADILARAKASFQQLKAGWNGYQGYDTWVASLNNARLVSLQTYRGLIPAFTALLEQEGHDLQAFYRASQTLARLTPEERQQELEHLLHKQQMTWVGKNEFDF